VPATAIFSSLTVDGRARKLDATDSPLRFGLVPGMIIGGAKDPVMQIRHAVGIVGDQLATGPDSAHPWDFASPNHDEVSALLKPSSDRKRTIVLVASALVAGMGLGWACGANIAAFNSITQTETPSRRVPEIKSSGKSDGARRMASTSVQTPPAVGAVPAGTKAEAASPGALRFSIDPASTQATTPPIAREPVAETKPTTIEGWTFSMFGAERLFLKGRMGFGLLHQATRCPGSGESIPSCVGATVG
jgi:hypothetical protein